MKLGPSIIVAALLAVASAFFLIRLALSPHFEWLRFLGQLALPIGGLVVAYVLIRITKKKCVVQPDYIRKLRLGSRSRRTAILMVCSLILAFVWPIIDIRFIDKNSLKDVLILAAPSLVFILFSAYCFLRLVWDLLAGWLYD